MSEQQTLLQQIQAVWRELPGLVGDRVELLSLELQRAGLALIQVVVLVVASAILGVTAWLVLWGGVLAGLVALGLHIALALLLVLVINAGAAWWAMARVRRLLVLLSLPGTRRHLTFSGPAREGSGTSTRNHEADNDGDNEGRNGPDGTPAPAVQRHPTAGEPHAPR